MEEYFEPGERISGTVWGFCKDAKGTVLCRAQLQYLTEGIRYKVKLDDGTELTMDSRYMTRLPEGE